jgi:hypothetical protein
MVGGFGGGTDYGLILTPDDGSGYWNIANVTGGALTFNNSATIGSSEQMRLTTTGLGIGQTPSTAKLEVAGEARVYTGSNLGYWGVDAGNSYVYFGTNTSNYGLSFQTSGTERMRITSGGDIQVKGGDLSIEGGTNYNDKSNIYLSNERTAIISDIVNLTANGDTSLDFQTRSGGSRASAMFIDEFRNIGIGTDSPGAKLEIFGTGNTLRLDSAANQSKTILLRNVGSGTAEIKTDGDLKLNAEDSGKTIQLFTNNTERMRIDSSGNVGIGTTSPLEKLNIVETTTTAGTFFPVAISGARYQADYGVGIAFRPENNSSAYANKTAIVGSGGGYGYNMADLHFCFNNSTTITDEVSLSDAKVTMKKSGNVGIGTTAPTYKLQVNGTAYINETLYVNGATTVDDNLYVTAGNVGIGTTSPSHKLYVTESGSQYSIAADYTGTNGSYGAIACQLQNTSPSFIDFYLSSSLVGAIVTNGSNVLYQSYSDYRLKENAVEMTGALDRVNNLKPKRFNFISQPDTEVDGFFAHELQEIVPQAVTGEKDEVNDDGTAKYQGVDNSQIVPLLVGAIQELKAEIETLKSQINN